MADFHVPMIFEDFKQRDKIVKYYVVCFTLFMILPIQRCIKRGFKCIKCCVSIYRQYNPEIKEDFMFYDVSEGFTTNYDTSNPLSHRVGSIRIYTNLLEKENAKEGKRDKLKIAEYEHVL